MMKLMKYAISISGFDFQLITKPFLSILAPLDFFVLLATKHEKSRETVKSVTKFLDYVNVKTIIKEINNIYDFYEVYIALESLQTAYGTPSWINVSAGPGIAISSLTYFSINNKVKVVSYDRENNMTQSIEVYDSKKIFAYMKNGIRILKALQNKQKSLEELSVELGISKSTVSRKISALKSVSLVGTIWNKRELVAFLLPAGQQAIDEL